MKSKISLIALLVILLSINIAFASPTYTFKYVDKLSGGFNDTLSQNLKKYKLDKSQFVKLIEKSSTQLDEKELQLINDMRMVQLHPKRDTLMQKVIASELIDEYLSGKRKAPKGFISICADVSRYRNCIDYFYGLRLDYKGTRFSNRIRSCGVIRFKAANIEKAIIPRSPENGGYFTDPMPFTGTGFTSGENGRIGTPEWYLPEPAVLDEGAELYEIFNDGTEKLRGVFKNGKFKATQEGT